MGLHLDATSLSVLISLLLLYSRSRVAHISLYNVSRETGISIATAYRKIVEMSRMGLVLRLGRGAYAITPKGAFYVAAVAIEQGAPDHVLRAAIRRLKEDWGVADLADEEVEAYVRLVLIGLRRLGRPPLGFCADDFGRTVQVLLPPKFGNDVVSAIAQHLSVPPEMVRKAERVIARAILEFFPSVRLPDGCRVVLMPHGEYGARLTALAAHCKVYGYTL
ncbi:MAG: transcriptional regulator, partial [Thermoproteus sp.]